MESNLYNETLNRAISLESEDTSTCLSGTVWQNMESNEKPELQTIRYDCIDKPGVIDLSLDDPLLIASSQSRALSARKFGRSLNYHRDLAQQIKDAIDPPAICRVRDGENLSLEQFLNQRRSVVSDAYEMSINSAPNTPGKISTLETLIDRLKACPWAEKIRIKFDGTIKNPDYDPEHSTISINPYDTPARQLQDFAHEAFHATHQKLTELYSNKHKLSPDEYGNLKGDIEARCFESEVKLTQEMRALRPDFPSPNYSWSDDSGVPQPDKDLLGLYEQSGYGGLKAFILDQARTRMQTDLGPRLLTYRQYWHDVSYQKYAASYEAGVQITEAFFQQRPDLQNY